MASASLAQLPAWLLSLKGATSKLRAEVELMRRFVIKHQNQHRRTRYWQSFRQVLRYGVHAAEHTLPALLLQGTALPASHAASAVQECEAAAEACRVLCARVAGPHQGAGFAPLAAALLSSCAAVWSLLGQAAAALRVHAGQGQGQAGLRTTEEIPPSRPSASGAASTALVRLPVPGAAAKKRKREACVEGQDYVIDKPHR